MKMTMLHTADDLQPWRTVLHQNDGAAAAALRLFPERKTEQE